MKKWHIFLLVILFGCEEVSDWPLDGRDHDLIVVEALVTNELKQHTVRLSRPVKALNTMPDPVSGAVVAVRAGNDIHIFNEDPAGSGLYLSDTFAADVDKNYLLYINQDGKEYFAQAKMIPAATMKPLIYRLVDAERKIYEIVFQESTDASKKEYWISWRHVPGYEDLPIAPNTGPHIFLHTSDH